MSFSNFKSIEKLEKNHRNFSIHESKNESSKAIDTRVDLKVENISLLTKRLYVSGMYEECLEVIDKQNTTSNYSKILQASCWSKLERNHEQAELQFLNVIKKEPCNFYAVYGLGLHFYLSGEFQKSISFFNQAYKMMPSLMKRAADYKMRAEKILSIVNEATTEFSKGNCYNAVKMLALAPAIDPENKSIKKIVDDYTNTFLKDLVDSLEAEIFAKENDELQLIQAEHLVRSNKLEEAAKLIPYKNTSAQCWFVKGLFSYYSGSLRMSLTQFSRALEEDPNYSKAHEQSQKAMKLIELIDGASEKMSVKDNDAAIEMLTSALEVDATNKRIVQVIYFQRAMCKFNQVKTHESYKDYLMFESLQNETGLIMNGIKF